MKTFEQKIGYKFKNSELLKKALIHPSYRFEHNDVNFDNQRLEFLGDAVLGLVAAEFLTRQFPKYQEGTLTKLRRQVANGKALIKIGKTMEIGQALLLGKGEELSGGRTRDSNIEDAVEAVLGAIYLDGGIKAVESFFERFLSPVIKNTPADPEKENPKGLLQHICQKQKLDFVYRIEKTEGPAHAKVFTVSVLLNNKKFGTGKGSSKRKAEEEAARNTLQLLDYEPDNINFEQ
jgi:ribonuclease III